MERNKGRLSEEDGVNKEAREFIDEMLWAELTRLRGRMIELGRIADSCGCGSCRRRGNKALDDYYDEFFRIYDKVDDHEEKWIGEADFDSVKFDREHEELNRLFGLDD